MAQRECENVLAEKMLTTIDRALGVLRLFTMERSEWTVEEAAAAIGQPTSSVDRYFRSLTEAGLIVNFAGGRYVVGPAIIELDRQTRLSDPLIISAAPSLERLLQTSGLPAVGLLCRKYGVRVMCVDQRLRHDVINGLSYERGRPMPLFRGSASKIILANLAPRILRRCFEEAGEEASQAGLGGTWDEFREGLKTIRRSGISVTEGELDPGALGISAPIFGPEDEIVASVSLVSRADASDAARRSELIQLVREAARDTSAALQRRAIG